MKITVFSDIHGNLPALEWLFQLERTADQYLFLGDAVNYGPWSNECVDLLASIKNITCIKGNHEEYFLQGSYPGKNELVQAFFAKAYQNFTRFAAIEAYQATSTSFDFIQQHTIEDRNIYPDTPLSLQANYFIGHSHHQFATKSNGFKLYNPGSIGQNRKFINLISYINWYPETRKVELMNQRYNASLLFQEMEAKGYPIDCINYYRDKPMF